MNEPTKCHCHPAVDDSGHCTPPAKWCEGGGTKQADAEGSCPVCGFKGKPTKYGVVRDHKERAS